MKLPFAHIFSRLAKRDADSPAPLPDGEAEAGIEKKLLLKIKQPHFLPRLSQLLHLHRLLGRREQIALALAGLFVVSGLILLGRAVVLRLRTLEPAHGGTYAEAVVGSPLLVNPLFINGNDVDRDLVRLIFAGLFRYNDHLELVPDLADRFEISDDGKTYTIHLKPTARFHDGTPLTASDVVFTIQMLQNPAVRSPLASEFSGVAVNAEDADTVVFTLTRSWSPFLHALTVGVLPEHRWSSVPAETARLAELNLKPIGAGQFRLKTVRKTKQGSLRSYTLEHNPHYHDLRPYLDTIIFKFYPDAQAAADALTQGNADGLAFVTHETKSVLTRRRSLVYHTLDLPQLVALFFNQKKQPLLADPTIRQALAAATPRRAILDLAFHGSAREVHGPLLPGFLGYTEEVTKHEENMAQADELLTGAGFKREGDAPRAWLPKDKKDKRYTLGTQIKLSLTTINIPEYVRAAELIRDAWSGLGVIVELATVDPGKIDREVIAQRAYEILLYGELFEASGDPFPFWHSSQATVPGVNLSGFNSSRVDALLGEARTTLDLGAQKTLYEEFQKIVTNELPAIFLLQPRYTYALDSRVQGAKFDRLGTPADRFAGIANWYVKTKTKLK